MERVYHNISGGLITNCSVQGQISGGENLGGLMGSNNGCIETSFTSVILNGTNAVGGFVGGNYYLAEIRYCFASSSITSTGSYIGGFVGWNFSKKIIEHCYSSGLIIFDATEEWYCAGGFVGNNDSSAISCCYSTVSITGNALIGGFVGQNMGAIHRCFWDIETSSQPASYGGEGKTTFEMQDNSTFEGWGYAGVWKLDEGNDYPRLIWQNTTGQLLVDDSRTYGGGAGTPSDPFLIYTAEQLNTIGIYRPDLSCHFRLMADIDLSVYTNASFNIIGFGIPFTGVFDGNNHKIQNFTWQLEGSGWDRGAGYVGLFGLLGEEGIIKNIGLTNVLIDTGYSEFVGALAGQNLGTIDKCYTTGRIQGFFDVGGLIGNNLGTIHNSYSTVEVEGSVCSGGLIGCNGRYWLGDDYIKGGIVDNCYASGYVWDSWDFRIGGFIGWNFVGIPNPSFWSSELSGQTQPVGAEGFTGEPVYIVNLTDLTDSQMKQQDSFVTWDFMNIWAICEGTNYPRLQWQIPNEDWVCPDGVNTEDLDYFVGQWLLNNCTSDNNYCGGVDMDSSGTVDLADLAKFSQHWLEGV